MIGGLVTTFRFNSWGFDVKQGGGSLLRYIIRESKDKMLATVSVIFRNLSIFKTGDYFHI